MENVGFQRDNTTTAWLRSAVFIHLEGGIKLLKEWQTFEISLDKSEPSAVYARRNWIEAKWREILETLVTSKGTSFTANNYQYTSTISFAKLYKDTWFLNVLELGMLDALHCNWRLCRSAIEGFLK